MLFDPEQPEKKPSASWLKRCCQRLWAKPFWRISLSRRPSNIALTGERPSQVRPQPHICKSTRRFGLWSGLAVAALAASVSAIDGWQVLELQSYNLIHKTRRAIAGAPDWDERIVLIAIDDATTAELGRYPLPREHYAELLDQLWSTQPAAITFDIFFPDPNEADAAFSKAIVDSANVVIGTSERVKTPTLITPTIAEPADGFFLPGDIGYDRDIDGVGRQIRLYGRSNLSLSVATLQVYAETLSSTTQAASDRPSISPDLLSRLRGFSQPPQSRSGSSHQSYRDRSEGHRTHSPSAFSRGTASPSDGQSSPPPFSRVSLNQSFKFATSLVERLSDRIPSDDTLWIRWPGEIGGPAYALPEANGDMASSVTASALASSGGYLQSYSFVDVLKGRVDNSRFQNKIVLIGATATGVDSVRTPFDSHSAVGGVYLHAATIDNLLNKSFLRRPPKWQRTLLLAALAIASAQLLQRLGVYRRLAILAGFPIAWSGFAYAGFLLGWWLPVAAPLGTVALAGLVIQLREQQEKQQLMDIFSMNVSPGTAELIWQHKDAILHRGELAAQTLDATVLFMDIRGFSSIAETLPSQQLLPWLNQYFETMTDCIMKHGGMVDKYIGDAIMAVFGAPLPRSTEAEVQADAIAALTAALEMHERLDALNLHLVRQNLPTIDFGIGIHTGQLIGGTVGSRHRLNYSVFGDTVNIAARIEGMTKRLPDSAIYRMLVSAETRRHTQARFPSELFRSGKLRGRQSNTDVYALVDHSMSTAPVASTAIAGHQPVADTRAVSA